MKKLLLSFIMILLPVVASVASIVVDGISYNINGNEAEVISLPDEYKSGDVEIPASFYYNGTKFNVTSIGDNVFNSCADLTGITIPKGVRTIGGNTFYGCKALTSITIPEGVTSIGSSAFQNCTNLASVTISSSVKEIGYNAFVNTGWYKNQPDGMVYIGNVAYKYKGTMPENTAITLKEGTTSISGSAFYNCANLTDISIPESVISIGDYSFYGCTNLASVTIPSSVNEIGYYAFENTAWYNNQPNGLIYIGSIAYKYKGAMPENTTIVIKEGTSSISSYAFDKCKNLTSITISEGMITIGVNAFRECTGLTSISIPEGVTSIGSSAFYWCQGLTSVTIPSTVKEIGTSAFNYCNNIKDVYISDLDAWCKIRFGDEDFDYSRNNQGSSPVHGHLYLNNKEVTEVHIPEGQTCISPYAFSGCSNIKSVSIPNSVIEIGVYSFYACNNLSSIIIPRGVQEMPMGVFLSCKLEKIVLRTPNIINPNPTVSSPFHQAAYNHAMLYVPMGSKWDMVYENGWYPFINIREIVDETEELSNTNAYTLLNAKTLKYSVYDVVNNKVKTVENLDNIDESVASNSWQIVDNQGQNYLYNIGAKKFASITASGDIELSEQAKPISMENGADGIVLGNNSDSQWNFVLNEKISADQVVTNVNSISDIAPSAAIYIDLNGREIPTPQKGMNIAKYPDGTTKKILVK